MKKTGVIFLLFLHLASYAQLVQKVDSLKKLLAAHAAQDTALVNIYNELSYELRRVNPDTTKYYAEKAEALATRLNFKPGIAWAYHNLGVSFHVMGDYTTALGYYDRAKKLRTELHDEKGLARTLDNIGISYYMQGYYDKALGYYNQALQIQQSVHDTVNLANSFNYLASVYLYLADYERALRNYLAAIKIHEKINDKNGLAQEYNNMGIVYSRLGSVDKAIESYFTSLKLTSQTGDKFQTASSYNNLGSAYQNKKEYDKALEFYLKSMQLSKEMNQTRGMAYNNVGIGGIYELKKDFSKALEYYKKGYELHTLTNNQRDMANTLILMTNCYIGLKQLPEATASLEKAMQMANDTKTKDLLSQCYQAYARLYKLQNDPRRSYEYLGRYSELRDSILNDEKNKSLTEMQTRFDTDKKEKEIVLLTKAKDLEEIQSLEQQANIRKQKVTIYASVGGITLAIALAFFVLQGNVQKRKANLLLEEKNEAIRTQKQVLEEKNIQITDSIEYAKSIQDAILPSPEIFKNTFSDSFVLFKPKDVVSGDFYWISRQGDETFVSAVDCVGHGVPGAFMALHSYNLLERIVKQKKNISPAEILNDLNAQVLQSLNQQNDAAAAKHGMDLALIKKNGNTVEFAGARNPLVIVTPAGDLKEVKADRMYVGGAHGNFTNNSVEVETGSMLYIFTDGYADQKGGERGKKFFAEPLRALLKEIAPLPCEEQKNKLEQTHLAWKGEGEQLDDILVIGIRV